MRYGCIGFPVSHSFSAEIHGFLSREPYELLALEEKDLPSWFSVRDFKAINVTIPYKQTVMRFLDEIAPDALSVGAVNTVINRNGRLIGYNTDLFGFLRLLSYANVSLRGKTVAVLGTGGTSHTVQAALAQSGAKQTLCVSRTGNAGALTYPELYAREDEIDTIVNTTPCGMFPDLESSPIDLSRFSSVTDVVDVIYHPLRTGLITQALSRRIRAVGGLYMLAAQAVRASEIFFDREYPPTTIDQCYDHLLQAKTNIVLIGMPSAGKTTIGRQLAGQLSRPFFDTDEQIAARYGKKPAQLICERGEAFFRVAEEEVVASLSAETGAVIACGGGTVLKEENVRRLKQNGRLFWLDRPFSLLSPSPDTPLTDTQEKMRICYTERLPLFQKACDKRIDASGSLRDTLDLIRKDVACETRH